MRPTPTKLTAAVTVLVLVAGLTGTATPVLGASPNAIVLSGGGSVQATLTSRESLCSGDFGLETPDSKILLTDYQSPPYGAVADVGTYPAGTELVFYLAPTGLCSGHFLSTDTNWAHVVQTSATEWVISWEDLSGASGDFNDLVLTITVTPNDSSPIVSSVSPDSGSFAGGTLITITGSHLGQATGVTFGDVAATSVTVVSDSEIQAVSPASAAGKRVDATPVQVRVMTPSGMSSTDGQDDTFWYRGVAVILIRGLASELPSAVTDDSFWKPWGLVQTLRADGWPAEAMLDYSYNTGVPSYSCADTAYSIGERDVPTLDTQIMRYANAHPHTDFYLVGHSQGGLIAVAYLTELALKGRPASDLVSGRDAHLAGIVTLDSPIGGINRLKVEVFSHLYRANCGLPPSADLQANLTELAGLDASTTGPPFGATASIASALFQAPGPVLTNETVVERAAADHGIRVLTLGNLKDFAYDPMQSGSPSLSTQWVSDAGVNSGVYARVIDRSSPVCDTFKNLNPLKKSPCYWTNHGLVLTDRPALEAIVDMFNGRTPDIGGDLAIPLF